MFSMPTKLAATVNNNYLQTRVDQDQVYGVIASLPPL
jgi:hypothetical protein